jgi:3-oxoacyl-[acyl-carrier protein] reductase
MDLGLKDKVAIVTGGSFGIGKAAAASLSAEGARVAIAARNQADLDAAAQEIEASTGNPVMGISTDIRDEVQVQDLVHRVVGEWGGVDILVNNAGTSAAHSFSDLTDEIFTEDFRLKVYGAMYCIRAALPYMKKSGAGAILNITTPGGKASAGGTNPTSMARAAGISMTKSLSKEFAEFNVRVNTVCIGTIKSRQNERGWERIHATDPSYSLEDHWRQRGNDIPLGRVGESHEAGDVICFLVSDRASYVTGTSVNVDGGVSPVV